MNLRRQGSLGGEFGESCNDRARISRADQHSSIGLGQERQDLAVIELGNGR